MSPQSPSPAPSAPERGLLGRLMQRLMPEQRFRKPQRNEWGTLLIIVLLGLLISVAALVVMSTAVQAMPLSAGDRIQLTVEAGEEFSGRYQIDYLGQIQLPFAGRLPVAGMEPEEAAGAVVDRLVQERLFKRSYARASVQVLAWAPLEIRVSGAVFNPGSHRINYPRARDAQFDRGEELPGAGIPERKLSDSLRAAGGITPYADLAHVVVRRQGVTRLFNLWGLLQGTPVEDPPLIAGDEVLVPLTTEFNPGLARISNITPPGIKIFVSNLIVPAASNANATTISGQLSLSYGSRWSQAVVAANCVGGMVPTSGSRAAVLVRTDRVTGKTHTWDAPVEAIIRNDGKTENPLLQEGDGVACYDSAVTGVRDVFRTLTDILNPISLWRNLP